MNKATEVLKELKEANSFNPTHDRAMEYYDKHKSTHLKQEKKE